MRREEKRKLSINRRIIVNHLMDLESVLDYLISKQIFTTVIRQKINKESQGKDRIRHMLDILESKNIVLAYQYFLEALVVTGNTHVAHTIEPDYCSSEQCRMVLERERIRGFHHETFHLPFPVLCTQNHSTESPSSSSPSSSSSLSNSVNSNALAPMSIQRIMRQNANYHHNNNSNMMPQQGTSSQCTSRSTSSSGCQSSSMSPTINRSRSSSVTAFLNSGRLICTSSSVNGLVSLASSSKNTSDFAVQNSVNSNSGQGLPSQPQQFNMRTPCSSGVSYDDSDQISPSHCSPSLVSSPTPTYTIDWSDVNNLELDFHVTKSFPNIRKQLSPNEVS